MAVNLIHQNLEKAKEQEIDKAFIDTVVGTEGAKNLVREHAESLYNTVVSYDAVDIADREFRLQSNIAELDKSKDKALDELSGTSEYKEIKTDEAVHENIFQSQLQKWAMRLLAIAGLFMMAFAAYAVGSKSTRFEFLLEQPLWSVMFIFPALVGMWLISWFDELIDREDIKRQYRFSLGYAAATSVGLWLVCFVLANVVESGATAFEAGNSFLEAIYITQLISQLLLEVLGGGILKLWYVHTSTEHLKEIEVPTLRYASLTRRVVNIDTNIDEQMTQLSDLRLHRNAVENGRKSFVNRSLAYLNKKEMERAALLEHAETTAKAASAAARLNVVQNS